MKTWVVAALLFAALGSGAAEAHYVWLEREGTIVKAYFGEWEGDLREVSGGTLDRITNLQAFGTDRTKLLNITKEKNHFAIRAAVKGDVRAVEERAPADDRQNGGKTKTMFQAKEGRTEIKPVHDLELVPVAANGDTFVLMLRGNPLAKAEVHVFGPPKWGKELTTDESGRVTIPTPWAGRYVAEVIHLEQKAGGEGADAYARIRHVSTLSFTTTKGIAWKAAAAK
jgi:hypothetical protein